MGAEHVFCNQGYLLDWPTVLVKRLTSGAAIGKSVASNQGWAGVTRINGHILGLAMYLCKHKLVHNLSVTDIQLMSVADGDCTNLR